MKLPFPLKAGLVLASLLWIQPLDAATHAAASGPVVVDTRNAAFTTQPLVVIDEATGRVQVTWSLGPGSEIAPPSVRLLINYGTQWTEALAVTGDAGPGQAPGAGKVLTWEFEADGLTRKQYGSSFFEIKLVLDQEAGQIAEVSLGNLPMPALPPENPVIVNFCYGSAADFTVGADPLLTGRFIGPLPGTMPAAAVPPGYAEPLWKEQVMQETEGLFRRAGVTANSMTFQSGPPLALRENAKVINVFFSPATAGTGNLPGFCGRILTDSRFNRGNAARVVVFIAGDGAEVPAGAEVYRHPVPVGEAVAKQVGLALGLRPVVNQATAATSVMDDVVQTGANLTTQSDFSGQRLDLAGVPAGQTNPGHNEKYYLQRWVEGIFQTQALVPAGTPGTHDLPEFVPGRLALGAARLALTTGETWYQVRVLGVQTGRTSILWREFAELGPAKLADLLTELPADTRIRILASSVPGGPVDRLIAPAGATGTSGQYFPVPGAPALSVFQVNADHTLTTLAPATLTAAPAVILPAGISLDPLRFGPGKVWLEFDSIPGQTYRVEWSTNLATWQIIEEGGISAQRKSVQLVDKATEPGQDRYYYRVRVN
ncbi:MAG: hypothetical protein V4675_06405 [Verrucomicrobiota bacterium]